MKEEQYLTEIISFRALTLNVYEVVLKFLVPQSMVFSPGQQINIQAGGKLCAVSISSTPVENQTSITVIFGLHSTKELESFVTNLKTGAQVKCFGPIKGFQQIPKNKQVLLLARNVGIGSFSSIVPALLLARPDTKVKLLFEVDREEDVFYFERFNKLAFKYSNFTFLPLLVKPHSHWPGEVGTISTYLEISAEFIQDAYIMVSGENDFIQAIKNKLIKIKFNEEFLDSQTV